MREILSTVKSKICKAVRIALGFIPQSLPVGMLEFDAWADSLINTYDLPDNDSIRFSLAVMIMHLDSTTSSKPPRFFFRSVKKGMANQVAAAIVQDLKTKQQDAIKKQQEADAALAAQQKADATATPVADAPAPTQV